MALLSYAQFLKESRNYNVTFTPNDLMLEGGAYGHLNHPFEDMDLTMQDFRNLINTTISGSFGPEHLMTEKCLAGNTVVNLEKRGQITICELVENKYEDRILSQNVDGTLCYLNILDWVDNGETEEWLIIETEDGQKIQVTPNHRIFHEGGDIKAEDLKVGDYLITV